MAREINENGTINAYIISGDEVKPNDRYGYKIVAVVYGKHFWAAYKGLTHWSDERCASDGDKVLYDIASRIFSTIDAVIPNYNH